MCDIFSKTVVETRLVGASAAMFAQWLTAAFVRTRTGKKVSERTRELFPLGYFLVAVKPE
jgi:hypothetical protein